MKIRQITRVLLVVPAAALLMFSASACGGGDDDTSTAVATKPPTGGTTAASALTTSKDTDNSADEVVVEISMKENVFTPKAIKVKANTKIKFVVKNEGIAVHNMHILSKDGEGKDFTSETLVSPGKSDDFEATFKKTGTYNFQCDYHLPDMVGKITVE